MWLFSRLKDVDEVVDISGFLIETCLNLCLMCDVDVVESLCDLHAIDQLSSLLSIKVKLPHTTRNTTQEVYTTTSSRSTPQVQSQQDGDS